MSQKNVCILAIGTLALLLEGCCYPFPKFYTNNPVGCYIENLNNTEAAKILKLYPDSTFTFIELNDEGDTSNVSAGTWSLGSGTLWGGGFHINLYDTFNTSPHNYFDCYTDHLEADEASWLWKED